MNESEQDRTLVVLAPLSGVLVPLEQVPDATFSQRLVGEGISIDPTSDALLAPVDGTVLQLNAAHHAVVIRTASQIDVMVHVGLDTVALNGSGFQACCAIGDQVRAGDVLLRFDVDHVASRARSLLTQIVVMSDVQVMPVKLDRPLVDAGEAILHVIALPAAPVLEVPAQSLANEGRAMDAEQASAEIIVPNPSGMHARPSAVLAAAARAFPGDARLRRVAEQGRGINMKSASAVMQLGLACGDVVEIRLSGVGARQALSSLLVLLRDGCGDDLSARPAGVAAADLPVAISGAASKQLGGSKAVDGEALYGQAAAPGKAVGNVVQWRASTALVVEQGAGIKAERIALDAALAGACRSFEAEGRRDKIAAQIFFAHAELLRDPELLAVAHRAIDAGKSASFSWRAACEVTAQALLKLDNPLLAARAHDLQDVGDRVVRSLSGDMVADLPELVPGSILVARNLTPSQAATLDVSLLAGVCLIEGGATGHTAILARARGLPMICGIDPAALALEEGREVVIDAGAGMLWITPSPAFKETVEAERASLVAAQDAALAHAMAPAETCDGRKLEIAANVAGLEDVEQAVDFGADGVGLLRSEFLFIDRPQAPTEDEQAAIYARMAQLLGPQRPLVIRTLDVGGDKPLSYLQQAPEENPFLGLRGIRLCLDQPELLRTQLRAILRASAQPSAAHVHVMFPMIATLDELRAARRLLEEERMRLAPLTRLSVGIMIEVPSAALLADAFAAEVDFFSIGTNDLAQYVMAMDRGHPKMSAQIDALHPAVLKMISMTVEAAHAHGKWVGLCGNLAAEPEALPLLIGLGLDELSVGAPAVPMLKQQVRALSAERCRALAAQALQMAGADEVRALLRA